MQVFFMQGLLIILITKGLLMQGLCTVIYVGTYPVQS